jgi:hypothetical protein
MGKDVFVLTEIAVTLASKLKPLFLIPTEK